MTGRAIALGMILVFGCGEREETTERCVPGRSVECACPGGGSGAQVCGGNAQFGPCECESTVEAEAAPSPQPEAAPSPQPADPSTAANPSAQTNDLQAAADATAQYLSAVRAYNARDERYYGHFADQIACFHGQSVSQAQLRSRRALPTQAEVTDHESRPFLITTALRLVHASAERVDLIDYGAYHTQTEEGYVAEYGTHEKAVRLERRGGRWLIVAEGGTQNPECVPGALEAHAPAPSFVRCRDAAARCDREARAECERPGYYGNACALELWKGDCYDGLTSCLESATAELRVTPRGVSASSHWQTESGSRAFPAERAFDGRLDTAWNSGGGGRGVGEWLEMQLSPGTEVGELVVTTGFVPPENSAAFDANAHVRTLHVDVDGETRIRLELDRDTREVRIPMTGAASTIRVVFDATWPGSRWEPLAISEVEARRTP